MDWDFQKCGSLITNPYCLNARPTDPYSWHYSGLDPQKPWVQQTEATVVAKSYAIGSFVKTDGTILVCTAPNGCIGGGSAGYSAENNWNTREFYYAVGPYDGSTGSAGATGPGSIVVGPTMFCDTAASGANGPAPFPDPRTGACEKRPVDGPSSNCVNPCIRLGAKYDGPLGVNRDPRQCRVFPNTTAGGNLDQSQQCQTVCPEACVELWESCPPGTGPLVSLMQTKTASDVIALSGPYRADGSTNPLWSDGIYVAPLHVGGTLGPTQQPIGGKPYTECYRFNTEYCELPIARQEQVNIVTAGIVTGTQIACFAGCPTGTYVSSSEAYQCLFFQTNQLKQDDSGAPFDPSKGQLQQVFCNPQYSDPIYYTSQAVPGFKGVQIGCKARPLPTKQGSTCDTGTTAVVNDNFNLEWCMPECPTGHVTDLTGSTCLATCDGSTQGSIQNRGSLGSYTLYGFNPFLDYLDYYSTQFKCRTDAKSRTPVNCTQDFTNGRCPATRYTPQKMNEHRYGPNVVQEGTKPEDVLIHWSSINTIAPARLAKRYTDTNGAQGMSPQQYAAWRSHYEAVKAYQTANPNGPNAKSKWSALKEIGADGEWIRCPFDMHIGDSSTMHENGNLCYDNCPPGYSAVDYCSNGATDCPDSQKVHACRAECPKQDEGLGPWQEVNDPPLYACKYRYPKGTPPADPNLWVKCPEDGRFTVQTSSSSDIATESSAAERLQPMCVRNTFLRYITCPIGFNEVTDPATGVTNCIKACNAESMVYQLEDTASGTTEWFCQSGGVQDGRYSFDVAAATDTGAKPEFSGRVLRRKNFPLGTGLDATSGITNGKPTNTTGGPIPILAVVGGLVLIVILLAFLKGRKK
jgi:hypothetical protein